jgi:membrane protein YqaA with SNARE-associated domain
MKHITHALLVFFWHFGGIGLLVLGILDSSFLFAPLGNDLLVVAASARSHSVPMMLYYAGMSTAGSVLGCLLVDVVFRRAGERGLERHLPKRRLEYIKCKVTKSAAWALIVASIAPPPFPFTPFVMAASALQYPREKLLIVTGTARMVRFTALGLLALRFGPHILRFAQGEVVQACLTGLILLCVVGSVVSVIGWIRRSRRPSGRSPEPSPARV